VRFTGYQINKALSKVQVFKKKVLNNRRYETFDEFKLVCQSFFQKRKKYLPELQRLLTENFHIKAA
jgi:hypothetical protein